MNVVGAVCAGLGILILAALLIPWGVHLHYDGEFTATVRVGGMIPVVRFSTAAPPKNTVPPTVKADKRPKQKKQPSPITTALRELKAQWQAGGASAVADTVRETARLAQGIFHTVCAAVTVPLFRLDLLVAEKDASETAQAVGRISAVLYPALTALQSAVRIRHRAVTVRPDFLADVGRVTATVRLTVFIPRLLPAALQWQRYRKNRKTDITNKEDSENGQ